MDDPYYEGKQLLYKDYSGQLDDAVFANTALTQDHYVNITGGNDKGTYMASMGYYNEDGQIKGTVQTFQRLCKRYLQNFPILKCESRCYLYMVTATIIMDWFL